MYRIKDEVIRVDNLDDLKPVLSAQGPCLSLYMPLNGDVSGADANDKRNALRWKECLRLLDNKKEQFGPAGEQLVQSLESWEDIRDAVGENLTAGASLAVFRTDNQFCVAALNASVMDRAVLGPHFYIRPLLSELVRTREFYLLALSQKHTRLLRCTLNSSEEIPLPTGVQTDFETWMNQTKPDHTAVYNAMTSGAQGVSGPNALAPKGSDAEKKNEYLRHFFKQIDKGLNELLKGKNEPLILCAVEYEIPLYREINHYQNLAAEEVRGAPNGLKSGEMHARALEALERCYHQKIEQNLAEWNHRVGGGASSRLKEVVTASHEGRVLTLLISDSDEKIGVYDEQTHTVKARETGTPADEDILNEAAVQTIVHGGKVLVVPHHKMPNGNPIAAIYRY